MAYRSTPARDRSPAARGRAPLQARSRRRWVMAAGIAGLWLVLLAGSGSVIASLVLLFLLGAIGAGLVVVLRVYGFGRDHPWFHRAASRPWRDGRDVLRAALRHLPEVFIVTPQGSLLAPNAVELRMNPADVESLADLIDLSLVNASAAEAYAAEVAAHSARVVSNVPLEVCVVADPEVPAGRYRLRQRAVPGAMSQAAGLDAAALDGGWDGGWHGAWHGGPAGGPAPGRPIDPAGSAVPAGSADPGCAAYPVGAPAPAGVPVQAGAPAPAGAPLPAGPAYSVSAGVGPFRDGRTRSELAVAPASLTGAATVTEAALTPLLRLITNGTVAETRVSGARAGRGGGVELQLPGEPTVSRVHATFTCTGGQWRITVLGRNGVLLNGTPLATEHIIRDGDSIRWGQQAGAPVSAVVIR
jgi:FHA domain